MVRLLVSWNQHPHRSIATYKTTNQPLNARSRWKHSYLAANIERFYIASKTHRKYLANQAVINQWPAARDYAKAAVVIASWRLLLLESEINTKGTGATKCSIANIRAHKFATRVIRISAERRNAEQLVCKAVVTVFVLSVAPSRASLAPCLAHGSVSITHVPLLAEW
jgi:hypothetical protein